jgi:asparagine synthetase B (glutamine-hydrolysing)
MSGIFGICKLNGNQIQISDMKIMASLLKHRGPDAAAYTLLNNNTVGLGQNDCGSRSHWHQANILQKRC